MTVKVRRRRQQLRLNLFIFSNRFSQRVMYARRVCENTNTEKLPQSFSMVPIPSASPHKNSAIFPKAEKGHNFVCVCISVCVACWIFATRLPLWVPFCLSFCQNQQIYSSITTSNPPESNRTILPGPYALPNDTTEPQTQRSFSISTSCVYYCSYVRVWQLTVTGSRNPVFGRTNT